MGGHMRGEYTEFKDAYDQIVAKYFENVFGYKILPVPKRGLFPDVVAEKGNLLALIEVKAPGETATSSTYTKDIHTAGNLGRQALWDLITPWIKNKFRGNESLIRLYFISITCQLFTYYKEELGKPNITLETYYCIPSENSAAFDITLALLKGLGLIDQQHKLIGTIHDPEGKINVYQIYFTDIKKEEIEQKAREYKGPKSCNQSYVTSVTTPSVTPDSVGTHFFPGAVSILTNPAFVKGVTILCACIFILGVIWYFLQLLYIPPRITVASVTNPAQNKSVEPTVTVIKSPTVLNTCILFDFDSTTLNAEGQHILERLASDALMYKMDKIFIEGHTCSIGSHTYNELLSGKRAAEVRKHLVRTGLNDDIIFTEACADNKPVGDNSTYDGRAQNRRAVVYFSKNSI
jgi:outer membrane protein OmpA-like peptidoglycan-associated protein